MFILRLVSHNRLSFSAYVRSQQISHAVSEMYHGSLNITSTAQGCNIALHDGTLTGLHHLNENVATVCLEKLTRV